MGKCKYKKEECYEDNSYTCNNTCDRGYCGVFREKEEKRLGKKIKWLYLFVFMFIGIFMLGMVSAVECGSTPTDGCTVSTSTTFDTGTYYLNGSTSGAIIIGANNIILDCNGATIKGNLSTFYVGIYNPSYSNIIINNCSIENYYHATRFIGGSNQSIINSRIINNTEGITNKFGGMQNSSIINNYFEGQTSWGIIISSTTTLIENLYIKDNIFNLTEYTGLSTMGNLSNIIIFNNSFYSSETHSPLSSNNNSNSDNWNITLNRFYGPHILSSYGPSIRGNNNYITDNLIDGYGHSIEFILGSKNNYIFNNTIQNGDDGIKVYSGSDMIISNNTIINMTYDTDTYVRCMWIKNANNISLINNNCSESIQGFNLQNSTNINIFNNYFNLIPFEQRINYLGSDRRTPACAINSLELEKSWTGSGEETYPYLPFQDNVTNLIGKFKSSNINISGNIFNSAVQCYFSGEGTINLTHDFTNYWYRSFNMPTYLKDRNEYYISNNYENLSWIGSLLTDSNVLTPSDLMYSTYMGSARLMSSYKIHKNYQYYKNDNSSTAGNPMFISVYNLTNSLIQYDNGTTIPVYGTNQEINLTLTHSQYVYVYTNTTTICDETNTTCYMNVTGMNLNFNETADGSLNLTFTDNDPNFLTKWYEWIVNGISILVGYGENVFNYVFNLDIDNNEATVILQKGNISPIVDNFNTLSTEVINTSIWKSPYSTGGSCRSWNATNDSYYGTNLNVSEVTFCTPGYREYIAQTIEKTNLTGTIELDLSLWGYLGTQYVLLNDNNLTSGLYNQGNYTGIKYLATSTNGSYYLINTYANGTERTLKYLYSVPNNLDNTNKTLGTFKLVIDTDSQNYSLYSYNNTLLANGSLYFPQKEYYISMIYGLNNGAQVWAWFDDISLKQYNEMEISEFLIEETISTPTIALNYPTALINYGATGGNLELNYTITDSNLDKCWYDYYGTNVTTACSSGVPVLRNITLLAGIKNVTIYANDTAGNLNATTYSWDYYVFETGQEYTSSVAEGTSSMYSANLSMSPTYRLSTASLIYNGTATSGTVTEVSNNTYVLSATKIAPSVAADTNYTFYWQLVFENSQTINTSSNLQTVVNIAIDNCGSYTNKLFNFTMVDEDTQLKLNQTTENTQIRIDMQFKNPQTLATIINYSARYNQTNPALICSGASIANSTFRVDALIEYSSTGRFTEFYNIQNYTLNTATTNQNITLYDLNSTGGGQTFKINYKDQYFNSQPGSLIQLKRKYVDEGVYKVIEIPMISSAGYATAHLIPVNNIYSMTMIKDGNIIDTIEDIIAYCPNPSFTDCVINLNSYGSAIVPGSFDNQGDFSSTLTYSKSTRTITSTFTIPSGGVSTVVLNATKADAIGTTIACSDSLTASSGTLTCTIPNTIGNTTIKVYLTADGEVKKWFVMSLGDSPSQLFGTNLVFLAVVMLLFFIGISVQQDPKIMGITLILGVIVMGALNLITSASWIGKGATVLWFVVAIILILIKSGNKR